MTHIIKLQKEFADAVLSDDKTFEIRWNDRAYQRGDCVKFKVMDGDTQIEHGLDIKLYKITYVLSGWGLKNGYVVLGIREVKE